MSNHRDFLRGCAREGVAFEARQYIVRCDCGRTGVRAPATMTPMPPDQVAKKFKLDGWRQRGNRWVCLACQLKEREKAVKPTATVVAVPPATAITVDKPGPTRIEPTIKEALAIAAILDARFHVLNGAFSDGWSDEKIAEQLRLPRAMVTKVREEGYGPLKAPPELLSLKSDVDAASSMIHDIKKRLELALAKFGVRV